MATSKAETNVRDHGKSIKSIYDKYEKAQCNYCQKVVSGFTRLKQHLACVGGDVAACDKVPEEVMEQFEMIESERKKRKRGKKVGNKNCAQAEVNISPTDRAVQHFGLRGFIIAEKRREMDNRITEIKSTWQSTGCSILVDWWRDARGHDLCNILVDCPEGPVYLKSLDISAASTHVDALKLVFEELISEVGATNVVQIMINFSSPIIKAVAEIFEKKHRAIFWSISSTRSIEAMCNPLHRMIRFLNPGFMHSTNFQVDREVMNGVLFCIVCSSEDKDRQDLIVNQLNRYVKAEGDFGRYDAVQRSSCISPVSWWYNYGGECPELQHLAIRILSQTCDGATKFNLDRSAAEKLLTDGRNVKEQDILKELTCLDYFFQLDRFRSVNC